MLIDLAASPIEWLPPIAIESTLMTPLVFLASDGGAMFGQSVIDRVFAPFDV